MRIGRWSKENNTLNITIANPALIGYNLYDSIISYTYISSQPNWQYINWNLQTKGKEETTCIQQQPATL